jgi:ComF family protein
MVDNGWDRLRSWLWPGHCRLCAATLPFAHELCPGCETELPRLQVACTRCAIPLPTGSGSDTECGRCQRRPPRIARAVALYRYEYPIDKLVLRLKFHRELGLARLFGEQLAARLAVRPIPPPDLIVPVPLHRARLRSRGYNQALELARPVAARLGVPLDAHGVRRARDTRAQSDLTLTERRRNLRGAFSAGRDYRGLRIAVVDDVMTSGSTIDALARCLTKAGAAEVEAWVVARA